MTINVFNAGEGEISGMEVDITALLTEGLTATVSYDVGLVSQTPIPAATALS